MIDRKYKTLVIFTLIFLISLTSAITIYSGESVTLELEKPYEYYSVVGNSSEVILNITQDGNNVTITPNIYSPEDSYEIVFFDKEKETITIYSGGGGSSTKWKTKYVDRNITKVIEVDKEVIKEVDKEIEVEKIIKKSNLLLWIVSIFLVLLILILVIYNINLNKRYNVEFNNRAEKEVD